MVPPRPSDLATGTERIIFSLLKQLNLGDDAAVALSSLNLSNHEYKRWGEVDFVLVSSSGILIMEVKGGKVTCSDGVWQFKDRWGRTVEKVESPMAQAQAGYSAIIKKCLRPKLGETLIKKAVAGFCVAFPITTSQEASYLAHGPEMPRDLMATSDDCKDSKEFKKFIERVLAYWRKRNPTRPRGWTAAETRQVVSELRPSFDRVPPLSIALSLVREEQCVLTNDQYRFLDYMETAPRVLCTGGAGCGKTFLAVESLRREMDNNPVLVTGTGSLAKYLRSSNIPDRDRIFSLEELELSRGRLDKQFSTLIVDEGQQITNEEAFNVLSGVLKNNLCEARWRWFSDPNHQLSSSSRFNYIAHEKLGRWATVSTFLRENCRNTPQIIRAVEFATGADIGSTRVKGSGPDVKYSHADNLEGTIEEAAMQIREWIKNEEVKPGHIVLLSRFKVDHSSIPRIANAAGLGYMPWKAEWEADPRYPRFLGADNVEDFRGLEAPFIVLCDLGEDPLTLEINLYLGMTRANFGLFIACSRDLLQSLALKRMAALVPR